MGNCLFGALVALGMLSAGPVAAQELPKWDAGASIDLIFGDGWHEATSYNGGPDFAYHVEVGRFLTTHFKADTAVVLTRSQNEYTAVPLNLPGIGIPYTFIQHDRRLTAVAAAATYQFFENQMMHPFVSAGAQIGVSNDHAFRTSYASIFNGIAYTVPSLDTRSNDPVVRPFAAVGAKSYFNERTYLKSEFSVAAASRGPAFSLRLGFGVDF